MPLISRRSRDTGRSPSSNLVGETHVPRNAPGTPQANAVFARPGRIRGSADESEERGGARRSMHTEVGSGKNQRGLGEEAGLGSGEREARLGATMRSPDKPTHRWPPDGQAAPSGTRPALLPRGPIPPDPPLGRRIPGPGNQRCDPAGPAAVAECRGPIRWNTAPSWSPHNLRTPACAY